MDRGFVLGGLLGSFEPAHRRPMILYQLPELARLAVGAKLSTRAWPGTARARRHSGAGWRPQLV